MGHVTQVVLDCAIIYCLLIIKHNGDVSSEALYSCSCGAWFASWYGNWLTWQDFIDVLLTVHLSIVQ